LSGGTGFLLDDRGRPGGLFFLLITGDDRGNGSYGRSSSRPVGCVAMGEKSVGKNNNT